MFTITLWGWHKNVHLFRNVNNILPSNPSYFEYHNLLTSLPVCICDIVTSVIINEQRLFMHFYYVYLNCLKYCLESCCKWFMLHFCSLDLLFINVWIPCEKLLSSYRSPWPINDHFHFMWLLYFWVCIPTFQVTC